MKRRIHFIIPLLALLLCSCSKTEVEKSSYEQFSSLVENSSKMVSRQSFENAMEDALSALLIADELDVDSLKAKALCQVAIVNMKSGNDSSSWEYANMAQKIAESSDLPKYVCQSLLIKGKLCSYAEKSRDFNRNDEGIELLSRAYDIATENDLKPELSGICSVLGDIYVSKNRWNNVLEQSWRDKADQYLTEAEGIANGLGDQDKVFDVFTSRLRYLRQGGDYQGCLDLCLDILSKTDENNYSMRMKMYEHIFQMNAALDMFQEMYDSHIQYQRYSDLFQKQKSEEILMDMQTKYQTAQKERIIERNKYQIVILLLAIAFLVFVVSLVARLLGITRKRNTELTESNQTKDKFLTIISHDLKNPALAQKNALKALVDMGGALDSATMSMYHKELYKASESHVNLILNMLDWARVQAGRITFSPTRVLLSDIVSDQIQTVNPSAKEKNISLSSTVSNEIFVNVDRNMISTVVRNLLTNAIKFTPDGGRIDVSAKDMGDKISCSVKDSGVGMTKEQIDGLFDIIKPKSTSGTKGETGTGLGFTVCREFVERNGGTMTVESVKGEGSTFTFTLKKD